MVEVGEGGETGWGGVEGRGKNADNYNWIKINKLIKKIHWDIYKWKHNVPKYVGCSKSNSTREVYSDIGLLQETRKILSKQLYFTSKGTRKRTKPKVSKKKKIIKVRVEINEIET